jgi:hypothetical protein
MSAGPTRLYRCVRCGNLTAGPVRIGHVETSRGPGHTLYAYWPCYEPVAHLIAPLSTQAP